MKNSIAPRKTALLVCAFALCSARALLASGGWDEQQPPDLSTLLDQLPAKSFGEIFAEASPVAAGKDAPDYDAEIKKIAARIGKDSPEKLAAAVGELLKQARLHYENGAECNLLEDVLDVVKASTSDPAAAKAYLEWRLKNAGAFDAGAPGTDPKDVSKVHDELMRLEDKASGPIKAHWLYLIGALSFVGGDRSDCQAWFNKVVTDFPNHPRAEAAAFLLARCDLFASRADGLSAEDLAAAQKKAASAFLAFRRKYPGGRFDADALGWLGAIAFDTNDYLVALKYYIAQAEDPAHPEQRKSAVFMCEKSLAHLASADDNAAAFALIAQHPKVAMGYMYQVMNAPESDNFDGQIDAPDKVRKWRRRVLPLIAAQVAKQQPLYKSGDWQPRYLAMLAQAASESGNQAQALQITEVAAQEIDRSDDLLFARGIALQRAGRAADAAAVYNTLLKKFPQSQLHAGVRLRLALALQDNHQAGAALIALRALLPELSKGGNGHFDDGYLAPADTDLAPTDSAVYPDIRGASADQVCRIIDTLLNFAPLTELAPALDDASLDAPAKSELRAVIAERYLVAEDFGNAKKFMTDAQFSLIAAKLEKMTAEANAAPAGRERAEKFAAVGDAWADARGKLLLLPLDGPKGTPLLMRQGGAHVQDQAQDQGQDQDQQQTDEDISPPPQDLLTRQEGGIALGFKDVDTSLEDRDELRHASRWWMRAARENPGTAVDASARLKALEAMPKIADLSEFALQRARDSHAGEASREIYNRLLAECPDSVEAKRLAAYWNFPEEPQTGTDNSGDDTGNRAAIDDEGDRDIYQRGYKYSDYVAFGVKPDNADYGNDGNQQAWSDLDDRIKKLPGEIEDWDLAHITQEVEDLDKTARASWLYIDQASRMNFLDDIALFVREKGVTIEMARIYIKLRYDVLTRTIWNDDTFGNEYSDDENVSKTRDDKVASEIDEIAKNPAMKPVADYIDCTRLAMVAARQTSFDTKFSDSKGGDDFSFSSRDYAGMEKMAREFLKNYPHSGKREAVMFVLARSVVSLSRPRFGYVEYQTPGTVKDDNLTTGELHEFRQEPFSAKRVLEVLDDYDKEFPNGRYAADISDFRAYVAWQSHDWGKALDLTLAQLADDKKTDLQVEASYRLANIFAELADKDQRADLLAAIRARPDAVKRLDSYLAAVPNDIEGHPLRYLGRYLSDQLLGAVRK